MRLLHQRHDHAGGRVYCLEQAPHGRPNQASIGLQPVPMWNSSAHRARREARLLRRMSANGMSWQHSVNRREILKLGGIIISFALPVRLTAAGTVSPVTTADMPKVVAPDRVDGFLALDRQGNVTV